MGILFLLGEQYLDPVLQSAWYMLNCAFSHSVIVNGVLMIHSFKPIYVTCLLTETHTCNLTVQRNSKCLCLGTRDDGLKMGRL